MTDRPRRVIRGQQPADELHLSFDRKVSPYATYQASRDRWIPTVPNSFGLPSGDSCPGMTSFCASCYAARNEQSGGVRELVEHNLRLLRAADLTGMVALLDHMIGRYESHADAAGIPANERIFRIHWDGDFFSNTYAAAWLVVVRRHPDIAFWTYTRSFRPPVDVIATLTDVPNLAVYLSVDADNAADAAVVVARYGDRVKVAVCAEDYQTGRAILPDRNPVVCPENAGRIGLTNEHGTGACVTCRLCPDDRRDILFSTSHRENAAVPVAVVRKRRSPQPRVVTTSTVCEGPGCDETIVRTGQRGRPRVYCSDGCRIAAYHARTRVLT